VQRALSLALADGPAGSGLYELSVDEVTPSADGGRLLVHVIVPAERNVNEALAALRRDTPRLRSEIAAAITRKRVPELSFAPAFCRPDLPGPADCGPDLPGPAARRPDLSGPAIGDDDE
jgi:hypothetical protein